MNRRLLVLVLAFLMISTLGAEVAEAESLPVVRVAFVHDRSGAGWATGFRDSLRMEIGRVLAVDYTVEMPAELDRTADGTPESVQSTLEGVLQNERVDLIVATGPLGSLVASRLPELPHPVIGSWVLDPEFQQVPYEDGSSGHHNYTYVTVGKLLSADLTALELVVAHEHLLVVGSAGWVAALPGDGSGLAQFTTGRTSFMIGDGTVDSILAKLPEDVDAIYLLPMVDMSADDIAALLAAFAERGLPVLSLIGEPEVRAGALVGVAPNGWRQRMYRRVALVAERILSGEDPAEIPVMMLRDGRLFLNARVAGLIGVSPSFETIIEAVMVDRITEPGAERIDLYTSMTTAQSQNRDVAAVENAVAAGHEQVNVAKSELLPQINLGLDGLVVDETTATFFPALSERTFSGDASLTQIIYSDGAWAGYTIEKHLQDARIGRLNRVRLDVGLEAATAYIDVLRAQTRLQALRQNLAFTRTNLERAQVRVAVGEASRSELYRWEAKIAAEQARVMKAAVTRRLTVFELNRVLYRPLEAPLELVDIALGDQFLELIDPRVDRYTRDPRSLSVLRDFLVQEGLVNSPELQQFDAAILAAERSHTAATRSFWRPVVGLQGSVSQVFSRGGEGIPTGDLDDTSWNVGVFLSLPLLEGGARLAETQRTTYETYRLTRARESAAQRVDRDVRDAVFLLASSRLAIDLARRSAEAARLNLGIVADNYTLGRVSLVDLLDAQTSSLNAELATIDAVNDYMVDIMRVERAVGEFTFLMPAEDRSSWIDELEEYERQQTESK